MVILFVLRPFSCIFINIASVCNIPFRFCAIFYETTHVSNNFETVIHVSNFNYGHFSLWEYFSLWAFFTVGIFPCGHFSLWAFSPVGIFPYGHFSCVFFVGTFPVGLSFILWAYFRSPIDRYTELDFARFVYGLPSRLRG